MGPDYLQSQNYAEKRIKMTKEKLLLSQIHTQMQLRKFVLLVRYFRPAGRF